MSDTRFLIFLTLLRTCNILFHSLTSFLTKGPWFSSLTSLRTRYIRFQSLTSFWTSSAYEVYVFSDFLWVEKEEREEKDGAAEIGLLGMSLDIAGEISTGMLNVPSIASTGVSTDRSGEETLGGTDVLPLVVNACTLS